MFIAGRIYALFTRLVCFFFARSSLGCLMKWNDRDMWTVAVSIVYKYTQYLWRRLRWARQHCPSRHNFASCPTDADLKERAHVTERKKWNVCICENQRWNEWEKKGIDVWLKYACKIARAKLKGAVPVAITIIFVVVLCVVQVVFIFVFAVWHSLSASVF